MDLTAYLEALNVASGTSATATRTIPNTTHECPECSRRVPLLQDRVPRLTSTGTAWWWRDRNPWAHNTDCLAAHRLRLRAEAAQLGDLWTP